MTKQKQAIFVGWVNKGKKPVDGETTKNQYIIAELEKFCNLTILDFYDKKSHPWIYLQAAWAFISKPQSTIIFSTSAQNVYSFLKLLKKIGLRRNIIHWVIGGAFATHVLKGRYSADVFNSVKFNLVQCKGMVTELEKAGVTNAKFVSNFKPIKYYPDLTECHKKRDESGKMRFVFMSRIMLDKGCDYILKAIEELNKKGYEDKYIVDFYGKVDVPYKKYFEPALEKIDNANYYGLLDLKSNAGYDTLATYHAMLFPSFWRGEGFAGVFIDAYIAGLPILASNWAHNSEGVIDGKTGVLYPVHDVEALIETMESAINGRYDLQTMSENSRKEAPKFQADLAVNKEYLRSIGLVD